MQEREIWVWVQHKLGQPNPIAAEAMTAAEELAAASGARLACVAVGWGAREVYRGGVARGAKVVYAIDDPILRNNLDDRRLAASLIHFIKEKQPLAVLFDGSVTGQVVAARVAAALGVTIVGEATALRYADGAVVQRCPLFGGSITTEVAVRDQTAVVLLRPGAWPPRAPERGLGGELVELDPPKNVPPVGIVVEEDLSDGRASETPRVVVVSGQGDARLAAGAQALARELGGKWVTVDEWGLSWSAQMTDPEGATSPRLYLALGIAGAFRRRAGSNTQETVVAVHPDAEAPIFKTATFGIVADPVAALPALREALTGVGAR